MNTVADIYPLTPAQQGMLFHSLYAPGSGVYVEQLSCALHGDLDVGLFRDAWSRATARHAVLRSAFIWERRDQPLQVIRPQVSLPWDSEDLQDLPPSAQQRRIDEYLSGDQVRGFDLAEAPLMRLRLFRLAERRHHFVWSFHHLLLDGWSASLVLDEISTAYEALRDGKEPAETSSPPFRDFIAWLKRQDPSGSEAWWRRTLGGFDAPTPLPLERARPGPDLGHTRFAEEERALTDSETESLRAFTQRHRLTLNTLLQGAWAILLGRYGGVEDVVFGCTVAGRPPDLPRVESMVGLFINTIPVRVRLQGGETILDSLSRLQRQQAEQRQHEHTPLAEIRKWSDVERNTPIFRSLVVFENYPEKSSLSDMQRGVGLEIRDVRCVERTNYPMNLTGTMRGTLTLAFLYDTERFEAGAVSGLASRLSALLIEMTADPGRRLKDLPLLSPADRHRIVVEWNQTETDFPRACVHDLFEEHAGRAPDAVALKLDAGNVSYAELNRRANRLARRLRGVGVGAESRVGVCLERSAEVVVALLAIVKAGGAYVPLDPAYPESRLSFSLADTGASVLLTRRRDAPRLAHAGVEVLDLDAESAAPEAFEEDAGNPAAGIEPDNLAYVIHTSGSTGMPKGVMVSHRNIVRLVRRTNYAQIGPGDTLLMSSPLSFDASTFEIWGALLNGAALAVLPPGLPSLQEREEFVRRHRVTDLFLTTALFHIVAESSSGRLESVRRIFMGGEAISPSHVRKAVLGFPRCEVIHCYGPTEGTTYATTYRVRGNDDELGAVPIGRPIANSKAYLLDRFMNPVPPGAIGEIFLGGSGIARGYLGRPDLTADRFIPDPFERRPGSRLYRTGDLGRYRENGDIEFIGRTDQQVKIRGFRIEPGEVEAVLRCHGGISEAIVVAHATEPNEKRLIAYVIPAASNGRVPEDLEAFLRSRLPDHMVPNTIVPLEALPLTPSGKVDRRSLPAPRDLSLGPKRPHVAPRTDTEAALAAIWAGALKLDRVGIEDDFFELGGDSILSIQVVARAREAGIHITPRQIFLNPTLSALASTARLRATGITEGVATGPVPLTSIQRWFLDQGRSDPHHFNQAVLLKVPPGSESEVFAEAMRHLIRHHDALRLRFAASEGEWRSWYAEGDVAAPMTRVDLSLLPEPSFPRAVEDAAAVEQTKLNLIEGPLLRAVHFDAGTASPGRLLIVIHHLVVDGISWSILTEDLLSACRQIRAGRSVSLPPATCSFKHWSERLTRHARSGALDGEIPYWLAEPRRRVRPLPVDDPGGDNLEASAESVSAALTPEETRRLLQEVPAAYHTRIEDALLTAVARTLAPWIGDVGVLVDLERHGREPLFDDLAPSRAVGWFTSIHPALIDLRGSAGAGEALRSVKEQLRAVPGKGIGYGLLRYLRGGEIGAALADMPRSEVSFNYMSRLDEGLGEIPGGAGYALAAEPVGAVYSPSGRRSHLIEIDGGIAGGRLTVKWTYSGNLHRRSTIDALCRRYVDELRTLIEHCRARTVSTYTPSDFPDVKLDQGQLDAIMRKIGGRT